MKAMNEADQECRVYQRQRKRMKTYQELYRKISMKEFNSIVKYCK